MTNDNSDNITFDRQSGISEDEQKEILAKINGITESRRRSLSSEAGTAAGKGKQTRFTAKKSGNFFPVLVNSAAVAALVAGLLTLSSFQGKNDIQLRTGTKIYNSAERALIEEIRKETSSRLETKEREIAIISSQLEEVDTALRELYSSKDDLTDEQRVTEARLKSLHDEYFASLAKLQDERSVILEEARVREVVLQIQLESRNRELAVTEEQSSAALQLVRDELERLSREQSQAATVEAQMGALFANLYGQIHENRLNDAVGTIQSMRNFLNTPAFQALRSIQARKELYAQSINALEAMVEEARRNQAVMAGNLPTGDVRPPDEGALTELRERNAQLEQTIASITTEGSGTASRLAELERTVTNLQNTNRTLETSSREKDGRINTLTTNLATQTRNAETAQQQATAAQTQIATLTQTVAARDTTINDLNGRMRTRDRTITAIRDIVSNGEITDMTVGQLTASLESIRQTLNSN